MFAPIVIALRNLMGKTPFNPLCGLCDRAQPLHRLQLNHHKA